MSLSRTFPKGVASWSSASRGCTGGQIESSSGACAAELPGCKNSGTMLPSTSPGCDVLPGCGAPRCWTADASVHLAAMGDRLDRERRGRWRGGAAAPVPAHPLVVNVAIGFGTPTIPESQERATPWINSMSDQGLEWRLSQHSVYCACAWSRFHTQLVQLVRWPAALCWRHAAQHADAF